MRITNSLKLSGLLALVVALGAGCAAEPEQPVGSSAADAIAAAKAANKRAADEGYEWRDTGKLIKQAEKALADGKDDEAIKLANKARRQAENAVQQKYAELKRIEGILATTHAGTGKAAGQYEVVGGDNLWNISGKSDIYGDPYQWPLIYKANQDQIKDADMIYPGQVFDIDQNPGSADVSAAIQHARTRGAWSLGAVEESDKAYLAR